MGTEVTPPVVVMRGVLVSITPKAFVVVENGYSCDYGNHSGEYGRPGGDRIPEIDLGSYVRVEVYSTGHGSSAYRPVRDRSPDEASMAILGRWTLAQAPRAAVAVEDGNLDALERAYLTACYRGDSLRISDEAISGDAIRALTGARDAAYSALRRARSATAPDALNVECRSAFETRFSGQLSFERSPTGSWYRSADTRTAFTYFQAGYGIAWVKADREIGRWHMKS